MKGSALKTWSVLLFFLALKAAGNSSMAIGMKQIPEKMSIDPSPHLRHAQSVVAAGVIALILALPTRMALSLADLSFVLPVTLLDMSGGCDREAVSARSGLLGRWAEL